jgi:biopolymer transport protein ExbB/biopolymer transport protein TolQ
MGQFTLVAMWQSMGLLAKTVFLTLIALSVWSLAVGVERYFYFKKVQKTSRVFLKMIEKYLSQGKLEDAIELAKNKKFKDSHIAQVLYAGLQELTSQQDMGANYEEKLESAKRAIERATAQGVQKLRRGMTVLATVGATSPFIGLFGTVFGIINAFQGMAATGSGGIGAIAAGIAEALVTTGTGIGVALPAVWFFNFYIARIGIFTDEMSNASSELIDYFVKNYKKGA